MPQQQATGTDEFYTGLDVETRIVVQQRTSEIKTLMRSTAQDIVDIGQKLIEVKPQLGHGLFYAWLRAEFEWSESAAVKFMQVAERFKSVKFTDLRIASSALYLLAAPSTPEPAFEEALQRAEHGEHISHRVAQEVVAVHKTMSTPEGHEREGRWYDIKEDRDKQGRQAHHTAPHLERPPSVLAPEMPRVVAVAERQAASEANQATHRMAVHFSSRTAEHCTPKKIISLSLACLGEIDLDPCSERGDPPNVPAHVHYTIEDDGLAQSWQGQVYMNPPYGREIGAWVEKLCAEYEAGQVTGAIALVPSRTDTQWWIRLREYPVCFVRGRLTFVGSQDPAPFPSAVFYLGRDIGKFCRAFGHLGDVYQRIVIEA